MRHFTSPFTVAIACVKKIYIAHDLKNASIDSHTAVAYDDETNKRIVISWGELRIFDPDGSRIDAYRQFKPGNWVVATGVMSPSGKGTNLQMVPITLERLTGTPPGSFPMTSDMLLRINAGWKVRFPFEMEHHKATLYEPEAYFEFEKHKGW